MFMRAEQIRSFNLCSETQFWPKHCNRMACSLLSIDIFNFLFVIIRKACFECNYLKPKKVGLIAWRLEFAI